MRHHTRTIRRCFAACATICLSWGLTPMATARQQPAIEVTPEHQLDPAGEQVNVRGSGYDEFKGIYVAWCVVPELGAKPTPCGGGEDRDGSSGNSVWVSSNPPAYGLGLAEPYDGNGGFEVQIVVSRYIQSEDGEIDCFVTPCAVATRNDHERGADRSQDAFAAVSFVGQGADPSPAPTPAAAPPPQSSPTASATPAPAAGATPSATSSSGSAGATSLDSSASEPGATPTRPESADPQVPATEANAPDTDLPPVVSATASVASEPSKVLAWPVLPAVALTIGMTLAVLLVLRRRA
ncbi:MAG: hypothetical protein ACI867_000705 [Glaciecola sp.]|jgi:hypothetical protein